MQNDSPKKRLDAVVREKFQLSWGKARDAIDSGKIFLDGKSVCDQGLLIDATAPLELKMNTPRTQSHLHSQSLDKSQVIYLDSQIVVVNKPAGISTVPFEKGETGTLEQQVCHYLKQARINIVQRLDRDTSGLIVFTRTREAEKSLSNQFRFHTVLRRYFALVHGEIESQTIESYLVENRGDGLRGSLPRGSSLSQDLAKPATTHVKAHGFFDGMTLVECKLETGRTHQIRIHLSEAGHPLVGERAYIREYSGFKIESPRFMLHAAELGFTHPLKEKPMKWFMPPPQDFLERVPERFRGLII